MVAIQELTSSGRYLPDSSVIRPKGRSSCGSEERYLITLKIRFGFFIIPSGRSRKLMNILQSLERFLRHHSILSENSWLISATLNLLKSIPAQNKSASMMTFFIPSSLHFRRPIGIVFVSGTLSLLTDSRNSLKA